MPKNDTVFSVWLRDLLTAYKIKQSRFAEMCGVDRSAVTHWIKGKRLPQDKAIKPIATALSNITGESRDDIKKELLWQRQVSIEQRSQ
jgi:transcriptional regulator with XRE-family HTH domain